MDLFCFACVPLPTIVQSTTNAKSAYHARVGRFVQLNLLFKGSLNRIVFREIRQIRAQPTLYYTRTYATDTRRTQTPYFHHTI